MKEQQFLLFRKKIDELHDNAVAQGDTELIENLNWVQVQATREGKSFYQKVYEVLSIDG